MTKHESQTPQLDVWQGEFGIAYTDRNQVDWNTRVQPFRQMLQGLEIARVLEVGCNRGHNLLALNEVLGETCEIVGVEPNRYALEIARKSSPKVGVLSGNAFDLPFKDGYFDLTFTAGVLIHISSEDLPTAMREIYRVSRRYNLAVEYYDEDETAIHYRGHDNLLWKRNFPKHYQTLFPDLTIIRQGFWEPGAGFDNTKGVHWWLLGKSTDTGA